ncbi:MAG: hypothetical protein RLY69_898 [Verrucomicrobiota bacterium]|jgi:hypothetical protein
MKISPTIMGGLRVDMEEAADWQLLEMIMLDARSCERGLAKRLADAIDDQETAADWSEWVVPELEQGFNAELAFVKKVIETARREAGGEVGPIWINPDDAHRWYGTLNQARLALETLYHFGPSDAVDLESLPIEKRGAFMRSQFYCALQSALLDHVMR